MSTWAVNLYGNAFVDRIQDPATGGMERRAGGTGNVLRALGGLAGLRVHLEASVGEDEDGRFLRTELARLGATVTEVASAATQSATFRRREDGTLEKLEVTREGSYRQTRFAPRPGDWSHVAYLDFLPSLDVGFLRELKRLCPLVSGDLCLTEAPAPPHLDELLGAVDVLFLSDENCAQLFGDPVVTLRRLGERIPVVVLHEADQVRLAIQGRVLRVPNRHLVADPLETLGAGDRLAARFMHQMLTRKPRTDRDWELCTQESQLLVAQGIVGRP